MTRIKGAALSVALFLTSFLAVSAVGMSSANAACTSFSKTATYSSSGEHSGYRIRGYNNCATGSFRADIAWAPDTPCATIVRNGHHDWYVGKTRGDVRGIVSC
ncbi:hypothetical protein [Blastococcus sp. SYSU D00695]